MNPSLPTPALLSSAISLLLLAHSGRFSIAASRLRQLIKSAARAGGDTGLALRVAILRKRLRLIRGMHTLGAISLLTNALSALYGVTGYQDLASWSFQVGLLLLGVALVMALREINLSLETLQREADVPSALPHQARSPC